MGQESALLPTGREGSTPNLSYLGQYPGAGGEGIESYPTHPGVEKVRSYLFPPLLWGEVRYQPSPRRGPESFLSPNRQGEGRVRFQSAQPKLSRLESHPPHIGVRYQPSPRRGPVLPQMGRFLIRRLGPPPVNFSGLATHDLFSSPNRQGFIFFSQQAGR